MATAQVRTRMAPSPTGEYHIGGIRTMLYNYAFAKKNNGAFILRIEDTDQNRLVPGALDRMLRVIKDYGLLWDEGPEIGGPYAPYVQSERVHLYGEYAKQLVASGHAYYCFCSAERLDGIREEQRKAGAPVTKYDKKCLNLSKEEIVEKIKNNEKHVIRFKMAENEEISFEDLFLGSVTFNTHDLDDYVLLKSDGFPTYHLAVIVDDHLMQISHVMRGGEWLPSTPKHILLYKAFGWDMPLHGHLPNLKEVGANKKLSKRSGTVDALLFLQEGYLPEALLNFLMLLGWNPGTEREIYTLDEFIQDFSLERVHKTDLVAFNREKLLWYNGHYIRNLAVSELYNKIITWSKKYQIDLKIDINNEAYNLKVLTLIQERLKKLSEFKDLSWFFYKDPVKDFDRIGKYVSNKETALTILNKFNKVFLDNSIWNREELDKICHEVLTANGYKPKEAFMTLRLAICGVEATPNIFDSLAVLGKDTTLRRLNVYLN